MTTSTGRSAERPIADTVVGQRRGGPTMVFVRGGRARYVGMCALHHSVVRPRGMVRRLSRAEKGRQGSDSPPSFQRAQRPTGGREVAIDAASPCPYLCSAAINRRPAKLVKPLAPV